MSYDLYFNKEEEPTLEEFSEYFEKRVHYKMQGTQALYENQDTGVYFYFDYNQSREDDHFGSFNINFFRPHIFGLEAEPEISSFISHFDAAIYDPQSNGTKDGSYSRKRFLKGYNEGNKFSYKAFLQQTGGKLTENNYFVKPTEYIESLWKWNYNRNDLQQEQENDIFIPKLFTLEMD